MVVAAIAGIVASLAGTYMSMKAADEQAKNAKYQAAVQQQLYDSNRQQALAAATTTIVKGDTAIEQHRNKVQRLLGAQQAVMAGQGLGGAYDDIEMDTRFQSNLDEQGIRYNTQNEADKWYTEAGVNLLKSDAAYQQGEFGAQAAGYEKSAALFRGVGSTVLMYDKFSAATTATKTAKV